MQDFLESLWIAKVLLDSADVPRKDRMIYDPSDDQVKTLEQYQKDHGINREVMAR